MFDFYNYFKSDKKKKKKETATLFLMNPCSQTKFIPIICMMRTVFQKMVHIFRHGICASWTASLWLVWTQQPKLKESKNPTCCIHSGMNLLSVIEWEYSGRGRSSLFHAGDSTPSCISQHLWLLFSAVWSGNGSPAVQLCTFPFFSFCIQALSLLNITSTALRHCIASLHYCSLHRSCTDHLATFCQGQI